MRLKPVVCALKEKKTKRRLLQEKCTECKNCNYIRSPKRYYDKKDNRSNQRKVYFDKKG